MEGQIDHVIALSNAWQTGAFKLSIMERTGLCQDDPTEFAGGEGST